MCFFFLDSDTPLNTTVTSRGHCGDSAASYLVSCEGRLTLIADNDGGRRYLVTPGALWEVRVPGNSIMLG